MDDLALQPYKHFDKLELRNPVSVRTDRAIKSDKRGSTSIERVVVGEAECYGYGPGGKWRKEWCVVTALPADVHHHAMSPEQVDEYCEALKGAARRVRERREARIDD